MTVIEHPVLLTIFGIPVTDTVVFTWVVMGLIILTVFLLKKLSPNLLEMFLEMILGLVDDVMNVDNLYPYIPLLGSLMVFLIFANSVSIIPIVKSPTADINTTIAIALVVTTSVHFYGVRKQGLWPYLKTFASPFFMFPIEIVGQFSRTIALALRLFGNVLSGDLIVAIIFSIIPAIVPIALTALSLFTGLLQAYILTTLAALYISSAVAINIEEQDINQNTKIKVRSRKELKNEQS